MTILLDSYSEENQVSDYLLMDHHPSDSVIYASACGQSFLCSGLYTIHSAKFYMKKSGSPTGNGHAVLYAHAGIYGTSSEPTGAALATSDNFDVTGLTTDYQLITFTFTGEEQYEMQTDTKYCIVFENPATGTINSDNYILIGTDNTSPTHDGNLTRFLNGSWGSISSIDVCFYLYAEGQECIESISATDSFSYMQQYYRLFLETISISEDIYSFKQFIATVLSYVDQGKDLISLVMKVQASSKASLDDALKYAGRVISFTKPFGAFESFDTTVLYNNIVSFNVANCPSGLENPFTLIISNYKSRIMPGVPFYIFDITGYKWSV